MSVMKRQKWTGVILLVVIAVASLIVGASFYNRLLSIDDSTDQANCSDQVLGDYAAGVGRALAAPPAPNNERTASTIDLVRLGRRFKTIDTLCKDGDMPPFRETTPEQVQDGATIRDTQPGDDD